MYVFLLGHGWLILYGILPNTNLKETKDVYEHTYDYTRILMWMNEI